MDYGIPINIEGKPNWSELREKFYGKYPYYEAKSVNLLEKLIQEFRSICQQVIFRDNYERKNEMEMNGFIQMEKVMQEFRSIYQPENNHDITPRQFVMEASLRMEMTELSVINGQEDGLQITPELADKFYFNTNLLKFIRKTILFNNEHTWKSYSEDLQTELSKLGEDHPAYLSADMFVPLHFDKKLLQFLATHGISSLKHFPLLCDDGNNTTEAGETLKDTLWQRAKFLCEFFKGQEDRTCVKKKKGERGLGVAGGTAGFGIGGANGQPAGPGSADAGKKKLKNSIATDEAGNIIYPILISSSLKLAAPGSKSASDLSGSERRSSLSLRTQPLPDRLHQHKNTCIDVPQRAEGRIHL